MLPTEIKVGHVFRYSYLWHWQHLEGREEGDKDRPCLVLALVTTLEDGTPVVRVLPITHTPPARADEAIEIPPKTKRRLGLDDERSWIVLSESILPGRDQTFGRSTATAAISGHCRRPCLPRSGAASSNSPAPSDTGLPPVPSKRAMPAPFLIPTPVFGTILGDLRLEIDYYRYLNTIDSESSRKSASG